MIIYNRSALCYITGAATYVRLSIRCLYVFRFFLQLDAITEPFWIYRFPMFPSASVFLSFQIFFILFSFRKSRNWWDQHSCVRTVSAHMLLDALLITNYIACRVFYRWVRKVIVIGVSLVATVPKTFDIEGRKEYRINNKGSEGKKYIYK